jgi:hypothetical protein
MLLGALLEEAVVLVRMCLDLNQLEADGPTLFQQIYKIPTLFLTVDPRKAAFSDWLVVG